MTFPNREIVAALRAEYPAGTRVKLLKMDDIQAPPVRFYVECKNDTANINEATRFSLDEAMKRAKFLNCGACHYSCVRIPA